MTYPTATANETRTSSQLDATRWLSTKTVLDGFGRPTLTSQSEDGLHYSTANFTIHTRAVYDGLGRAVKATNPYRGSGGATTDGWSRTAFDLAGRVVEVATFSGGPGQEPPPYPQTNSNWTGSVVSTYNGEVTTVRDQANKQRRSTVDALGRLKVVDELHENGSLYAATSYTYDARGNLKTVTQGAQNRNFNYDALSRLTSAFNPESGNIGYTYDANSNLKTRTDARIPAVVTTYNYDPLNRVTTRTYSDGTPTVNYVYDTATRGVGRLASVGAVGVSTTNYTEYDRLGRIIQYNQVTDSQPYFMGCAYNKAGLMTSETYPSTKVVVSEYDGAGRLAGVKQQATGAFYAGGAASDATNRMQYTAHGAVSQMKLGNGLWEHTFFNSRLQPTQIGLGTTSTSTSVLGLDYTYNPVGQPQLNNGNILTQTISAPGLNVTQTYTYDHLNRLKTASESGSGWLQVYEYDRYGNRAVLAGSHIPTLALTPQSLSNFNTSNNRITLTGFNYDGAGNLTSDATTAANAMGYDGENRQVRYTKGGATTFYEYDGAGQRVKKEDGTNITIFVYNAGGQLVAEYATNAATGPMTTSYLTTDHLGSTRVVTKQGGSVKSRRDYLPFGEELGAGIGSRTVGMGYSQADGIRQQFTGKERDNESGLDYFGARYYSSAQGRFTSADPIMASIARLIDPQQYNRFSYARNNPLKFFDPDGRDVRLANASKSARDKARASINKNLSPKEAANIGVSPRNNSLFVVNSNAIKPSEQSEAYKRLVGLIGNRQLKIDFHFVEKGTNVITRDGLTQTHQELQSRGGEVVHINSASGIHDAVVPEGDNPSVMGTNGELVSNPDFIVTAHELLGETFKLMPGNEHLLNDPNADSQSVIDFDNLMRSIHGLPTRSGEDHGPYKVNIQGQSDVKIEPVKSLDPQPLPYKIIKPPN